MSKEAGLDFTHVSGDPHVKTEIYEANSGGVAWIDYDDDGDLDLFLVNGLRSLRQETPGPAPHDALYRNDGGRFVDVRETARIIESRWGMGVAVGDIDNNGTSDIYVTNLGPNALWLNRGDGTFAEVASAAGVADEGPGSGAAFGDIDNDGWLDLYVSNYVVIDPNEPLMGGQLLCHYGGISGPCGPRGLRAAPDRLYRNRGDGTFEDVTSVSGLGDLGARYGFDVVFLDVENDGDADIYVANDNAPSSLLINDGRGKFRDNGLLMGVAFAETGLTQAGMGVDVADYNDDGWPDIIKTNFSEEAYNLYTSIGDRFYIDRAFQAGLAETIAPLGFGAAFVDVNSDAILDIFFANGHIFPIPEGQRAPFEYAQQNLLFLGEQVGGERVFRNISLAAGLGERKVSRGVAVGDYDGDGDLDLVISNLDDTPSLLQNQSDAANWLSVRTVGTRSNRDGYGAKVMLRIGDRVRTQEVRASRGYLSSSDPAVFFGLGEVSTVEMVAVRWPSGRHETFLVGPVNRRIVVQEGQGRPVGQPGG